MVRKNASAGGISREEFNHKIDFLEVKMEQIERKISNKADEVVTIQILQHRQELEDIYASIKKIEEQIQFIDQELLKYENAKTVDEVPRDANSKDKKKRAKVTPLFT